MISRTVNYYLYHELPDGARRRAYETWRDSTAPNAQLTVGQGVDEDLSSLKAALGSVGCKLADWDVNLSGWGVNTCRVEVDEGLAYDMGDWDAGAETPRPALEAIPEATGDGCWMGEGFKERWNAECRPKLEGMLSEMREAYAACAGDRLAELADVRGNALYEAYLNLAQEQADKCMAEIGDEVEAFWSEEGFESETEAQQYYYEEDGTFAGRL